MTRSSQLPEPRSAPGLALLTALVQPIGTGIVAAGQSAEVGLLGYALLVFSNA